MSQPGCHLLDINDLTTAEITDLLDRSAEFASGAAPASQIGGVMVGLLFFQASTRTRVGFHVAAAKLGGTAFEINHTKHQEGMAAPESLEDTVRVLGAYSDVLVIRHSEVSEVLKTAEISPVPMVCGGAGHRFHPTQTLIDLYAIRQRHDRLDSLCIGIAGDIRTSRTAHSLLRALARFSPTEVRLMAPESHGPDEVALASLPPESIRRMTELNLKGIDVLYMAGMPPGIGADRLSDELRDEFFLTAAKTAALPGHASILCALPRTGDIHPEVDADSRSAYFEQSADGLFVRMSILEHVVLRTKNHG